MSRLEKPLNVLMVIVDDLGVHQLGCYGSTFNETPNLDRFGAGGVRLDRAYCTSPVCSPARASLYTGRHPARLHLTNYIPGTVPPNPPLLTPDWRQYLPVEEVTLGDAFKAAGRVTAHFGKWHLGVDYNYQPNRPTDPESQGFDEVMVTRKPSLDADPESDPHWVDALTDRTIRFMEEHRTDPFLCVLAHNSVHRPEVAPARLVEKYAAKSGAHRDFNRPVLAAMVEEVDRAFGRLLDALERLGLRENTLVVFTSDHGAFGRSEERKPLRGAKADLYEAGIRVPCIASLPGVIPAGTTLDCLASGADVFPTVIEASGVEVSPDIELDGMSLWESWRDPGKAPRRDALYWHYPHYHHLGLAPCGAIREGPYKLVEWYDASIGGVNSVPAPFELFNLEKDPSESRDIAGEEPEVAARLADRLRDWRRRVGAQEMVPNPRFDPVADGKRPPPPPGDPTNPYD